MQQFASRVQVAPDIAHELVAAQRPDVHDRPVQQLASVVQAAPDIAHAGVPARQVPDWHVLPVQQSASVAHELPTAWHWHRPARQSIAPQHWVDEVHGAAASAQQSAVVGLPRHDRPVQHCDTPRGHAEPADVHAAGRHTPDWQLRPEQQSASAEHTSPLALHAQRPPVQIIWPQHSRSSAQVAPASAQQ